MRRHLEPGPDHPITIEEKNTPVSVKLAGDIVLASKTYVELREATYPAVAYIPRETLDLSRLIRSDHTTWCPYKGEAAYFHVRGAKGEVIENAVWTYETPFPAVAAIKDALAVYPNKVDAIEIG
ncbi:MAG: DUF427 domain-containing protein [Henriciella sp.]|nr:DUF427 domain-containing protein [Henriciella sp.]